MAAHDAAKTAAAYLDLSEVELEREVANGRLPLPVKLGNSLHWSQSQVDAAMDLISGDGRPDWRLASPLYNGNLPGDGSGARRS